MHVRSYEHETSLSKDEFRAQVNSGSEIDPSDAAVFARKTVIPETRGTHEEEDLEDKDIPFGFGHISHVSSGVYID
jgi:hypothetical protein